jgi:hypothetical protein
MYVCCSVAGWGLTECPADGRVVTHGPSGYLAHIHSGAASGGPSSSAALSPAPLLPRVIGTESCPWTIVVHPGQTVSLRVIVLPPETTTGSSSSRGSTGGAGSKAAALAASSPASDSKAAISGSGGPGCAAAFVIREPFDAALTSSSTSSSSQQQRHRQQYNVCAGSVGGKSRERHLYTSAGNSVTVHVTSTRISSGVTATGHHQTGRESSTDAVSVTRFVISYEGRRLKREQCRRTANFDFREALALENQLS